MKFSNLNFLFFSFGLHICEGNECCENLLTFSRFLGEIAASVLIFLSSLSVQWKLLNNVLVAAVHGTIVCRASLTRQTFRYFRDRARARADAKSRWKFRQIIDQIRKTLKWMIKSGDENSRSWSFSPQLHTQFSSWRYKEKLRRSQKCIKRFSRSKKKIL